MGQRILQDWAVVGTGSFTARIWNKDGQIAGFVTVTAPGASPAFIKDCVWAGATYSADYVGLQVVQVTGTLYVAPVLSAATLTTSSGEALAANFNIGAVALIPGQSETEFGGGGGGAAAWGDITGTLSAQTDLQSALDAKADDAHTHLAADISNSTTAGRSMLTAADAAAQRSLLSLGALALLGSVGTTQIDNNAVTYAKLQDVSATQRVLGRNTGGSGDAEEVTAPQLLDWLGSTQGNILYRSSGAWTVLAPGTAGQVLKTNGSGQNPSWADQVATLTYVIDGGGATITTGIKGDLEIPFGCTIQSWTLLGDQSGSIVIDIWKDTYANYAPTIADTITASAKPTISAALKGQSSTLTGWTTAVAAGDILRFNVDSVTSLTRVTISIKVVKT